MDGRRKFQDQKAERQVTRLVPFPNYFFRVVKDPKACEPKLSGYMAEISISAIIVNDSGRLRSRIKPRPAHLM